MVGAIVGALVPTPPSQPRPQHKSARAINAQTHQPSAAGLKRQPSAADLSSKFFFRSSDDLFGEVGSGVLGTCFIGLLSEDLLSSILERSSTVTLHEAVRVNQQWHRVGNHVLRALARRIPRQYYGGGKQSVRRHLKTTLPARFCEPKQAVLTESQQRAAPAATARTHAHLKSCHDGGVRLHLCVTRQLGAGVPPPTTLSEDRTRLTRAADGHTGWSTMLVDRWVSRDVFTVGLVIEELNGPCCIGAFGLNHGVGDGLDQPPQRSRHAIVVDADSGRLHFKGRETRMILPRARSRCGTKGPVLFSGCRLNVIVDMQRREMHLEQLSDSSHAEGPSGVESKVEVELLPAEVAVGVSLGPPRDGGNPSRVRLVGASHEPPDVHSYGKTVKDLWDEDNVVRLASQEVRKRANHGASVSTASGQDGSAFSTLDRALLEAIVGDYAGDG